MDRYQRRGDMKEGYDDTQSNWTSFAFSITFRMFSEGFTKLSAEMYFRRTKILKEHFETLK